MRPCCILLVAAVSLFTSSNALSPSASLTQTNFSTVSETIPRIGTNGGRFLRTIEYEVDEDDAIDDRTEDNAEEEHGFFDLAMKLPFVETQLNSLSKNDGSIDKLKKLLKLDKVADDAFTQAKGYNRYDKYVTRQIKIWSAKGLTPNDVLVKLGIAKLSGTARTNHYNYKYYEEYIRLLMLEWSTKGLAPKEVLKLLGMDSIPQKYLHAHPNFPFFDEYVSGQIPKWVQQDLSFDDVKVMLGMDKLSPEEFKTSPTYGFYFNFAKEKVASLAAKQVPLEKVKAQLGLTGLSDEAILSHSNLEFFLMFRKNVVAIQVNKWLDLGMPTSTVWLNLNLEGVAAQHLQKAKNFDLYASYVKAVDDKGVVLLREHKVLPEMFTKIGTEAEMTAKAKLWAEHNRSRTYVKYLLGMSMLDNAAIKTHPNYKYYELFVKTRNQRKVGFVKPTLRWYLENTSL